MAKDQRIVREKLAKSVPSFFQSPFIVPLLTGAAYLIAYRFEQGRMSFYGIYGEFVEVRLASFIGSLFGLMLVPLIYFIIYTALTVLFKGYKILWHIISIICIASAVANLSVLLDPSVNRYSKIVVGSIIPVTLLLALLAIRRKSKTRFSSDTFKKLDEKIQTQIMQEKLLVSMVLALVATTLINFSGDAGYMDSAYKRKHILTNYKGDTYELVQRYDNDFLLAKIVSGTILTGELVYLPNQNSITFFSVDDVKFRSSARPSLK